MNQDISTKTIFITVYDGDIEKNYLRSGVLQGLVDKKVRVVLLIRAEKDSERHHYYVKNFASENVIVEVLENGNSTLERYLMHWSWNTLPTRSAYVKRHDLFIKHKNRLRYALESIAGYLGKFRTWRNLLRAMYYVMPEAYGEIFFKKYQPSLLFAPNMFSADDCRLLRYAKKHGIKTITTAKSWDVPTTRGFTRVKADRILVYNEINKREIIDIGDYEASKVKVIGFPQFDYYHMPQMYISKEEFYRKIGADLNKKLVLFAVPGDFKNPFTNEILQMLDRACAENRFHKPIQILARFHPKYVSKAEQLKDLHHVILDRPGTYFSENMEDAIDAPLSKTFQWTFTDNDIRHLANSLYHASVTINTESTMTLDAMAVGKPVVLIGFDGYKNLPYWESVIRNYSREHLQSVIKTKGVQLAESMEELITGVNRYLDQPNADQSERALLIKEVLYKNDGKSVHRVIDNILEML